MIEFNTSYYIPFFYNWLPYFDFMCDILNLMKDEDEYEFNPEDTNPDLIVDQFVEYLERVSLDYTKDKPYVSSQVFLAGELLNSILDKGFGGPDKVFSFNVSNVIVAFRNAVNNFRLVCFKSNLTYSDFNGNKIRINLSKDADLTLAYTLFTRLDEEVDDLYDEEGNSKTFEYAELLKRRYRIFCGMIAIHKYFSIFIKKYLCFVFVEEEEYDALGVSLRQIIDGVMSNEDAIKLHDELGDSDYRWIRRNVVMILNSYIGIMAHLVEIEQLCVKVPDQINHEMKRLYDKIIDFEKRIHKSEDTRRGWDGRDNTLIREISDFCEDLVEFKRFIKSDSTMSMDEFFKNCDTLYSDDDDPYEKFVDPSGM